jgi:hypothetical protein
MIYDTNNIVVWPCDGNKHCTNLSKLEVADDEMEELFRLFFE